MEENRYKITEDNAAAGMVAGKRPKTDLVI